MASQSSSEYVLSQDGSGMLDPPSPPSPQVEITWQDSQEETDLDVQMNENSNGSSTTVNYDAEDSNSSVVTTAPWNRTDRISITDDNPDPARPHSSRFNEDSNFSAEMQTANEESNSSISTPGIHIHENSTDEPPAKIRKLGSPKSPTEDVDGQSCPICLETWSNSGEHRLVALKCGHLFGSKCVERWLKARPIRERSCPTCKSKATMKDIRFIYARQLVATDTSEITALQQQIESLQAEKIRTELELQKSRIAHRACIQQLETLRNTLMKSQVTRERSIRKTWRFALEKNLEICKNGGCRVMTYNCRTYELYVSQKSMNNLFPGYGIRKVSCVDFKLGQFVHLHPKPIRDISYSQPNDLLLSVGLDSTARIVERGIPSTTIQVGTQLWSCCWDHLRSNEFYVGGVGGSIHHYDVRNSATPIQRLSSPGDISPVVSLCSTEYGLLSCQLNSSWLWVPNSSEQWEPRTLPVEGPFMSLCYDDESHRALLSCRPSVSERSRLVLCKMHLNSPSDEVTCDVEQSFSGSSRVSLMSRASWVRAPGAAWAAAHSESDSALFLHGLDGARSMSLPAAEPALDVSSVQLNGDSIVAALSESRLRIYKAVPTNS